jgi:hypothetical protein
MMETFTAEEGKRKNGIWYFECPLHNPPLRWHESNSMIRSLPTMKQHMDEEHPGIKIRLRVQGEHLVHTTYTAMSTVVPREDIL